MNRIIDRIRVKIRVIWDRTRGYRLRDRVRVESF